MATIQVQFVYLTGLKRRIFDHVRLEGSWKDGKYSPEWSSIAMQEFMAEDGCPAFRADVQVDDSQASWWFHWGVRGDRIGDQSGRDLWLIPTEGKHMELRKRTFQLRPGGQTEVYRLTHCRYLGANKLELGGKPRAQFAVWAPNAKNVEVVFGSMWASDAPTHEPHDLHPDPAKPETQRLLVEKIAGGYISDDGQGIHPGRGPVPMERDADGVWHTVANYPDLAEFDKLDHKFYMYRVTKDNDRVVYRTDLYSRCQVGFGSDDPDGRPYFGLTTHLDGGVSCSAVVNPDTVTGEFKESPRLFPERVFIPAEEFWKGEFTPGRPVPRRLEDLVIYELHVGALGFDHPGPGTLEDALRLLTYLEDLGVNAVELLPMSEFGGGAQNWGYATSHYFAIEYGGGGRDHYKYFIRECHRRGIAVILDVVYNHYVHRAERAQWMYDTDSHEKNRYYWYEGHPDDYPGFNNAVEPSRRGQGGYVDNMSTGWAPSYHEEMLRKMFTSAAMALVEEFHVDGFRVDQTTSIHAYNKLHADGRQMGNVNAFGGKLLRELTRSLKMIKPEVFLIAEDHSDDLGYPVRPADGGGLGFDAVWYANFYHHLIGDTNHGDTARLLKEAGYGDDRPLNIDGFAATLASTGAGRVTYHESHDEAGNGAGTQRTIVTAVNSASLVGDTRRWAEARCRLAAGLTILSAGTPMFLFGEEVGSDKPFLYNRVLELKEDLLGLRASGRAAMFRYYAELILLRLAHEGLRSQDIRVVYTHNDNRVLAFRRWHGDEQFLVVASFNNRPFGSGYIMNGIDLPDGEWREVFNSDASRYGGWNVGNLGRALTCREGRFEDVVPSNGLVVFRRE